MDNLLQNIEDDSISSANTVLKKKSKVKREVTRSKYKSSLSCQEIQKNLLHATKYISYTRYNI